MKALTLINPWGWSILHQGKTIENRTWRPPAALMGERFAIHAGRKPTDLEARQFIWDRFGLEVPTSLPTGAIVGTVRLVGVVELRAWGDGSAVVILDHRRGFELSHAGLRWLMDPPPGKRGYGWVLADPRPLAAPIPCNGAQGLWDVPPKIQEEIDLLQLAGVA